MDELSYLHEIIFNLIETGIFQDIDAGLPFYYFIMDKNGNELLPIQYRECKAQDSNVKVEGCSKFWQNQLKLSEMMKDVVFAKCNFGFGTLAIPLIINKKFVGLIGGCIPKKNIPQRAVEKSIALFRGISRLIELMGNKEFFAKKTIDGLSIIIQEVKKGYSIEDSNSIFYSPIQTIQKILVEFNNIFDLDKTYLFVKTEEKNKFLFISSNDNKIVSGNEGVNYYINNIKNNDVMDENNPLYNIMKTKGKIYPIGTEVLKFGYFFIPLNQIEELEKYIFLIIEMFSSIFNNYILFKKINKKGEDIYDNELINFFLLEQIIYYSLVLKGDSIKNQLHFLLKNDYAIYVKENLSSIDNIYYLFSADKNLYQTFIAKNEIPKNFKSFFDGFLYIKGKNINNELAQLIKELIIKDIVLKKINQLYYTYIYTLINGYQFKEPFKIGRIELLNNYSYALGKHYGLSFEQLELLLFAIYFIDIGLIGTPDEILQKESKLTKEEYKKIKRHPYISYSLLNEFPHYKSILPIIEAHHENWDGSGYPKGLKGDEIPIQAQIIHIVDSYVALISPRKQRKAFTKEEAFNLILHEKGKKFNSKLVDLLKEVINSE